MSKPSAPQAATFIAAPDVVLDKGIAAQALAAAGVLLGELRWLDEGRALDAFFCADEAQLPEIRAQIETSLAGSRIDAIVQPQAFRRKLLLLADMDSTVIKEECLDELAEIIGQREAVARLTERAMRGEVDFCEALTTRTALFAGVAVETIDEIVQRLNPNPGAMTLVATMRAYGAYTALVSGGFTLFAGPIGARLCFDAVFANLLEIESGRLTGRITPPIQGAATKAQVLARLGDAKSLAPQATLAVGDGANDLEMLGNAGLGVAFRAKPVVREKAQARLDHADLTALLYAQGFAREEFVER